MQLDFEAESPGLAKQADVGLAAQRGFQGERLLASDVAMDCLQQQTRCFHGAGAGIERRKAARDFVRVQKADALHFGQKPF